MSWNNKVVWSEGMFLQPQHFQQHDRYLAATLEERVARLRPYSYGFSDLRIDEEQLKLGKLSLLGARGVLPDGTPFSLPQDDDLPEPLDIPPETRGALVVLALPTRRQGIAETDSGSGSENFARFRIGEAEVHDSNGQAQPAWMQVGKLRLRLALASQVVNAHTTLGVTKVVERRTDNTLSLDTSYIPACLDYKVSPRLVLFVNEIIGALQQRGVALANRLSQPGTAGAAEITDFLFLQTIARYAPLFDHFGNITGMHPEDLLRYIMQLAGETMIFAPEAKKVPRYKEYKHDDMQPAFEHVMLDVRKHLAVVMDAHAVPIPLQERQFGIRVGTPPDPELIKSAAFVLAVNADMPAEQVRVGFPAQVKMGPIEKIRDLVNLQLPGITLRPLPVAPRQLPFHAGYTYFELDRSNELWKSLTAAGFAMHVAGTFPGLQMEFWAIKR
jgi:type VI secretion system protein ImpJ